MSTRLPVTQVSWTLDVFHRNFHIICRRLSFDGKPIATTTTLSVPLLQFIRYTEGRDLITHEVSVVDRACAVV